MATISLNKIIDVTVEVNNPTVISSDFNLGLIIGNSEVLTADNRVKVYTKNTYQTAMVTDGFETSSPEYLAVVAYFAQNPSSNQVAVGVKLSEETDVQAVTNSRNANGNFYGVAFAYTTTDSNMAAVAAAVEAFAIPTYLILQSQDENALVSGQNSLFKTLKDGNYNRTSIYYSTQEYFSCATLGVFSGLNSMQPASAYTMAFKTVAGFVPENVNDVQAQAIWDNNGNVYGSFGRRHNFIYQGLSSSGRHTDQQYMIDVATFLIQENSIAGLAERRVVPQTDNGVTDIISFITDGCLELQSIGLIATGIWNGNPVLDLNPGDVVQGGYRILAEPIASQSAVDRAARVTPPIYVCIKSAGAIEAIVIRVFVNL